MSSRLVSGLPGDAMFVEVQLPSLGHLQDHMMPEHMMSQLLILLDTCRSRKIRWVSRNSAPALGSRTQSCHHNHALN